MIPAPDSAPDTAQEEALPRVIYSNTRGASSRIVSVAGKAVGEFDFVSAADIFRDPVKNIPGFVRPGGFVLPGLAVTGLLVTRFLYRISVVCRHCSLGQALVRVLSEIPLSLLVCAAMAAAVTGVIRLFTGRKKENGSTWKECFSAAGLYILFQIPIYLFMLLRSLTGSNFFMILSNMVTAAGTTLGAVFLFLAVRKLAGEENSKSVYIAALCTVAAALVSDILGLI